MVGANNILLYSLLGMIVLFIGSNAIWLYAFSNIANKLMSRNYAEYVQANNLKSRKKVPDINKVEPSPHELEDVRRLDELNSRMGMV